LPNRLRVVIAQPEIGLIFLGGVILILGGGICVLMGWPYRAAVLSGIGGSLAAAALVSAMNPLNDQSFHEFRELGIKRSFFNRAKIEDDQWCKWLRKSRLHCTLLGIAHHKWCEDPSFPEALSDSLRRGVKVTFLFLNPDSDIAKQRAKEDTRASRNTVQAILDSIKFIWRLRQQLEPSARENLKLYVYQSTPSSGTSWFDNFMIVTHYLAGFANVTSPALLVEPVKTEDGARNLYDIYMENLNKIREQFSAEIDEQWINGHFPPEEKKA
jgi:hypothetical protein